MALKACQLHTTLRYHSVDILIFTHSLVYWVTTDIKLHFNTVNLKRNLPLTISRCLHLKLRARPVQSPGRGQSDSSVKVFEPHQRTWRAAHVYLWKLGELLICQHGDVAEQLVAAVAVGGGGWWVKTRRGGEEVKRMTHGSGECMGAEEWRMYCVHWNTLKAKLARKSLADRRPATGRSWKPVFSETSEERETLLNQIEALISSFIFHVISCLSSQKPLSSPTWTEGMNFMCKATVSTVTPVFPFVRQMTHKLLTCRTYECCRCSGRRFWLIPLNL